MTSEDLKTYFQRDELKSAEKIVRFFHGKLLISDDLSNADTVLLITYMISNKEKSSSIDYEEVREFYAKLGRKEKEFRKVMYELTKRPKKSFITREASGKLSLTFTGLSKVKSLFKGEPTILPSKKPSEYPSIAPPTSARDAIVKVLSTDWGKTPHTLKDIVEAMKVNAVYYPSSSIARELNQATRTGLTRRFKTESGYAYVLAKPI